MKLLLLNTLHIVVIVILFILGTTANVIEALAESFGRLQNIIEEEKEKLK
jgi:Sec-independent protein translocase protein TatA